MKKSKSLSIIMAMMIATQGGNSAVYGMKVAMKKRIENHLLQALYFRPDLISVLNKFLPENLNSNFSGMSTRFSMDRPF